MSLFFEIHPFGSTSHQFGSELFISIQFFGWGQTHGLPLPQGPVLGIGGRIFAESSRPDGWGPWMAHFRLKNGDFDGENIGT